MKSRQTLDYALLVGAVGASRFLFRSHLLYDVDSVNFALAFEHYNPQVHQPHPPGYFLYVCLGRLVDSWLHDANAALVLLSIVASCGAVAAIYALTDAWFGRRPAVFAGLIFVFSPLCWFHGTVALTYILEAFFSALLGYLCWQTYSGRIGWLVPSAILLGLAAGFRQSSILFLGPLWLLSLRKASRRQAAIGFLALGCATLAWFVPMALASGGLAAYFTALYTLWRWVPAKDTVLTGSIAMAAARLCAIVGIYGLCFGSVAPLLWTNRRATVLDPGKRLFAWVWVAPGLAFFALVFLKWVNSGYLLVLSPPVFAILGLRAGEWYVRAGIGMRRKLAVAGAMAALNAALFLYAPLYCSYRSVKTFEADLSAVQSGLRRIAAPENTLIVGFDSHMRGYRHAAYYLPDYWTVLYPEVPSPAGKRIFAVHNRNTRLLGSLPLEGLRNFVLFPLPEDEREFRQYEAAVAGRFPDGALRTEVIEGHRFFIGSTADLPILFPTATQGSARAYTKAYTLP